MSRVVRDVTRQGFFHTKNRQFDRENKRNEKKGERFKWYKAKFRKIKRMREREFLC